MNRLITDCGDSATFDVLQLIVTKETGRKMMEYIHLQTYGAEMG